jgi:hypothetical protein
MRSGGGRAAMKVKRRATPCGSTSGASTRCSRCSAKV